MSKSFEELKNFKSFLERYNYLKLTGMIGEETFGFDRYLNQVFYNSYEWKKARQVVIIRDNANDLGCDDRPIQGTIVIHHMNPINIKQVLDRDPSIFDPNFLISTSQLTHKAIHFGDEKSLLTIPEERRPHDTSPWRK